MNVTTDATHWCDQCHKYLGPDRPAVFLLAGNWLARICVVCLREAVEACEREAGERVVRGSRE